MQITIEDISPVEKRVDFELPWADVAPKLDKAYNDLRRDVRLKGFRPGKVPRALIEKMYRRQVEDEVARDLIELSIGQAIQEKQIQPVAPPTVDTLELKSGAAFKFTARVEVRSQVVPKDYTGLALSRRPAKVSDEQIAEALEQYRRRLTEYKAVDGRTETAASDVLMVELHGRVGEHKVKRRTVGVDLEDEAGGPLPGLATRLRGLPIDAQNVDVKYTIPEDLPHKELAGKAVSLHVSIKEAREKKQPALDDDLAKDTGEAETLQGLRDKIRERLLESDRQRIHRELMSAVIKELVKRNDFPIAPALVERHAQAIVNRAKQQLMMAGIDVEAGNFDDGKMREQFAGEAEEEARGTILVQAIAEREGITVTDADIQKRVAELAAARQENPKKLRAELEKDHRIHQLRSQIVEQKTLDMLIAQAKITDEDPVTSDLIAPPDAGRLVVTPDEARAEATAKQTKKRKTP
ncbi:MAG TPA: trigger factor [Polyangia bacterium]|jgi:trigger factor|nr:trigger factor [Polyangia bacterium]